MAAGSGGMSGGINWYRAAGAGLWPANMPSVPGGLIKMIQTARGLIKMIMTAQAVKGMPKTSTSSVPWRSHQDDSDSPGSTRFFGRKGVFSQKIRNPLSQSIRLGISVLVHYWAGQAE